MPAYRLENRCRQGRYRIDKEVLADPRRDVVLQRTRFAPLQGEADDYRLYLLLAPHLANHGAGNTAWVGDYKGRRCSSPSATARPWRWPHRPWLAASAGLVGGSDGWQQLHRHGRLTACYRQAGPGTWR